MREKIPPVLGFEPAAAEKEGNSFANGAIDNDLVAPVTRIRETNLWVQLIHTRRIVR